MNDTPVHWYNLQRTAIIPQAKSIPLIRIIKDPFTFNAIYHTWRSYHYMPTDMPRQIAETCHLKSKHLLLFPFALQYNTVNVVPVSAIMSRRHSSSRDCGESTALFVRSPQWRPPWDRAICIRDLGKQLYRIWAASISTYHIPLYIYTAYSHSTHSARGPTKEVRFWRLKSVPALKEWYSYNSCKPITWVLKWGWKSTLSHLGCRRAKQIFFPHGSYNNISAL